MMRLIQSVHDPALASRAGRGNRNRLDPPQRPEAWSPVCADVLPPGHPSDFRMLLFPPPQEHPTFARLQVADLRLAQILKQPICDLAP